jgi:MSHA biogenesis protein MshI
VFSFAKRRSDNSLTAIIPWQDGLSIAAIRQDNAPVLQACEFIQWQGQQVSEHDGVMHDKVKQYGLTRNPCTTILPLGEYTVLSVEAPDVPASELKQAIRWQIKDLIDFHIDDAVLDVFDAPASGASGHQQNLYVVVSRLSSVRERINSLQHADINLTTIDVPELVLRNITARLPEDENGVAFIYLERDRGLLVLTRNQTLYLARTLDLGYETLQDSGDEALGESTFNPVFDRVVLEVQRSLDYYDRYFVQPPIAGIVLAPSAQPVPGLVEYLSANLGVAGRELNLNDIIQSDIVLDAAQQAHCLMAIGAALRTEKKTL